MDLDKATHETFEARRGERFLLSREGLPPLELELVGVEARGQSANHRQAFSILFRGPKTPVLQQSIRSMTNEALGELAIFLVPVGPDEQGMLYEAVFT